MASFDSGHADQVHDAQLDYYGRRLATCSSDRTIKVFEVAGEQHVQIADLRGHEGPVWQVAWAHPKYGSLLASCSFDHRIIVWKESADGQWQQVRFRGPWMQISFMRRWLPVHDSGKSDTACRVLCIVLCGRAVEVCPTRTQVYLSPSTLHTASVNSIAWAPHEVGLMLAAASSDGTVSILEYNNATTNWDVTKVRVGGGGG